MPLNKNDRDLMIRTIIGEAANESPEGQAAVAHVIMNRTNSGKWGSTPSAVVLAPGQFEPWQTRTKELVGISPNSPQYQQTGKIVDSVASGNAQDFTGGATHFLNPTIVRSRTGGTLPDWAQGKSLNIGGHSFYAPDNPNYDGSMSAIRSAIGGSTPSQPQFNPDDHLSIIRDAIGRTAE
jgi:conjugal transfer mating pair stabilization protein TraG